MMIVVPFSLLFVLLVSGCAAKEEQPVPFLNGLQTACPGCDANTDVSAQEQCVNPCMKACLDKNMGVTSYGKVREGTEMKCSCDCSSEATDDLAIAKATILQDLSLCEDVANSFKKNVCYIFVAREMKDESLCEKIELKQGDNSRDSCYIYVAREKVDKNICGKVITQSGSNSKDVCNLFLAQETGKAQWCEEIKVESGDNSQDTCYIFVALQNKDASLCEKINVANGGNSKDACYTLVANKLGDVSLCEKVQVDSGPANSKEACYLLYAIKTQDPSLCEKATTPELKAYCVQQIR